MNIIDSFEKRRSVKIVFWSGVTKTKYNESLMTMMSPDTQCKGPWHFGADPNPEPHLWLTDPDPDPDPDPTPNPTPFFSDFQDAKKNFIFLFD